MRRQCRMYACLMCCSSIMLCDAVVVPCSSCDVVMLGCSTHTLRGDVGLLRKRVEREAGRGNHSKLGFWRSLIAEHVSVCFILCRVGSGGYIRMDGSITAPLQRDELMKRFKDDCCILWPKGHGGISHFYLFSLKDQTWNCNNWHVVVIWCNML